MTPTQYASTSLLKHFTCQHIVRSSTAGMQSNCIHRYLVCPSCLRVLVCCMNTLAEFFDIRLHFQGSPKTAQIAVCSILVLKMQNSFASHWPGAQVAQEEALPRINCTGAELSGVLRHLAARGEQWHFSMR